MRVALSFDDLSLGDFAVSLATTVRVRTLEEEEEEFGPHNILISVYLNAYGTGGLYNKLPRTWGTSRVGRPDAASSREGPAVRR